MPQGQSTKGSTYAFAELTFVRAPPPPPLRFVPTYRRDFISAIRYGGRVWPVRGSAGPSLWPSVLGLRGAEGRPEGAGFLFSPSGTGIVNGVIYGGVTDDG